MSNGRLLTMGVTEAPGTASEGPGLFSGGWGPAAAVVEGAALPPGGGWRFAVVGALRSAPGATLWRAYVAACCRCCRCRSSAMRTMSVRVTLQVNEAGDRAGEGREVKCEPVSEQGPVLVTLTCDGVLTTL